MDVARELPLKVIRATTYYQMVQLHSSSSGENCKGMWQGHGSGWSRVAGMADERSKGWSRVWAGNITGGYVRSLIMSFTIVSRDLIISLSDAATALFLNTGHGNGCVAGTLLWVE